MGTNTSTRYPTRIDELPPFPEGWYFVATRESIAKRKLIEKSWLGEEIVAWCDEEGRICVADAFCPHLGSHMGPTVGGLVRDGCLVCPFHGFTYDTAGQPYTIRRITLCALVISLIWGRSASPGKV